MLLRINDTLINTKLIKSAERVIVKPDNKEKTRIIFSDNAVNIYDFSFNDLILGLKWLSNDTEA